MTPAQCTAARAMLGWSEQDLALRAGTRTGTVMYFESGRGRSKPATVTAIRTTLEAAGVEFTSGDAPGVKLRKPVG